MSKQWNARVFLAKAWELSRLLRSWHIEDFLSPVQFASQQESTRFVRLTFREIIADVCPKPSPQLVGRQVYTRERDERDEEGCIREGPQDSDADNDRSLTIWLMGNFQRHLDAAPPLPALDYLKEAFGRILDLPAWTVREPQDVWERSMASYDRDEQGGLRWYMVTGRPVPAELLDALTAAAGKLLTVAPAAWGAITEPVPADDVPSTVTG